MNHYVKIISILVFIFIAIVSVIIVVSAGFANDLLEKRIQNQFLGEASNRGNIMRSLLNTYNDQIKYLIYQIAEDKNMAMFLNEGYEYLENRTDLKSSYNNLKDLNTINVIKPVLDETDLFANLQRNMVDHNSILNNSATVENIKIFDRNGLVLLSTNPLEIGKMLYNNNNNALQQYQNITKNTLVKFGSKVDDNDGKYKQTLSFISPFPPVEIQEDSTHIHTYNSNRLEKDEYNNNILDNELGNGNKNEHEFYISTEISTDSFNKILTNRNGLGETGEVYLVNKSATMISESRFINNTFPILVNTQPVRECFYNSGKNINGIYNDYRAISIVGFSYCAKDLGFVLLSEIDESEIYQPVWELRNKMVEMSSSGVFILLIISVIIVSLFISWNKNLKRAVTKSTFKLKETNYYLQNANEQLKKKDEIQKQFINIAAHELRTPTQAIIGYIEMLQESIGSIEGGNPINFSRIRSYIQALERNSNRLLKLVADIVDITKIESGQIHLNKEDINLNEKVEEVIKSVINTNVEVKENNLQFVFNGFVIEKGKSSRFKQPVIIKVDQERIYQVLFNLLNNAVKFSDKNGKISIILEKSKEISSTINLSENVHNGVSDYQLDWKHTDNMNKNDNAKKKDTEQVIVRIHNTGKGIDSSLKSRLFDKFATSSEKGMGLGLYISKNIIESHGGRIWIKEGNRIEKQIEKEQPSDLNKKLVARLRNNSENINLNGHSYDFTISFSLPIN